MMQQAATSCNKLKQAATPNNHSRPLLPELEVELVKERLIELEECARQEADLIGQKQMCVQQPPDHQQAADSSFPPSDGLLPKVFQQVRFASETSAFAPITCT
jgi:hypothetical protein